MYAQGTLYMSRTAPLAVRAADGTFQLSLLLMDRIGPHCVEPWRVVWTGEAARAWWQANQGALQPGQALQVQACGMRAFVANGRAPETHARVIGCALAGKAAAAAADGAAATEEA